MGSNLTPTEELILGVLAARVRLGESVWTFGNRHLRALRSLRDKGVVQFDHAPVEGHQLVRFTQAGHDEWVTQGYVAPVARLRDQLDEHAARLDVLARSRRTLFERLDRTEHDLAVTRAQLALLTGHLGGAASATDLDACTGHEVVVLRRDGSTVSGRLEPFPLGWAVLGHDGDTVTMINPVGEPPAPGLEAEVDVVRPVRPGDLRMVPGGRCLP